jgi:hypothetical protein
MYVSNVAATFLKILDCHQNVVLQQEMFGQIYFDFFAKGEALPSLVTHWFLVNRIRHAAFLCF